MVITILGAGTMGVQLAILCAMHNIETKIWHYRSKDNLYNTTHRLALINSKMGFIEKAKIDSICSLITSSSNIEICDNSDIIIEAVKEDIKIKEDIFRKISSLVLPHTVIATNTSTLSITGLASLALDPAKCIGVHFFNPPISMKLVEVIKGEYTSDETVNETIKFLEVLKKTPVVLPESPGFVVNRLLFPMINEAIFMLSEGVADARTIDNCMKLGSNHPMGPLELADFIGLDVCLSILETMVSETGDVKYRPAPLLKKYVRAGKFGRKSGMGFYLYRTKN